MKRIALIITTIAVAFSGFGLVPTMAQARPYLHIDEAQCALEGCYGSDDDIGAWGRKWNTRFYSWAGYQRYNSYDVCIYAEFTNGVVEAFEAYYPHSYDNGPADIFDADRTWCPSQGITQ